VTQGDKNFLDCQHIVPGGTLVAPAVDPVVVRRTEVIDQARKWYYEDFFFLDTETSGKSDIDQVIEIAIVDSYGTVILNTRVRPTVAINPEAQAIHGISEADLVSAPFISEIQVDGLSLLDWLDSHQVVTYNAEFDARLITQSFKAHNLRGIDPGFHVFQCAMKLYAKWNGEKHAKSGDWKYVTLTDAAVRMGLDDMPDHSAVKDAMTTFEIISALAMSDPISPF
jgi:DNA polymerase-3 subunit epsilon